VKNAAFSLPRHSQPSFAFLSALITRLMEALELFLASPIKLPKYIVTAFSLPFTKLKSIWIDKSLEEKTKKV